MNTTITLGFGYVKYGTILKRTIEYTSPEKIHYIEVDCKSCTKATYKQELNTIDIEIDTTKVGAKEGDIKPVTKHIYIHGDPNKEHYLAKPNFEMVKNPDKPITTISCSMVVQ